MTRAPRILVVDDEPSIQKALTPLLASRGYEVESAVNAQAALRAFESLPPDLVVLDLGLPDMDGPEVCRRIRAGSNLPILVLSARTSESDRIGALDLGADDYIVKPFSPEELLARIRVALRHGFDPESATEGRLECGNLTIDFDRRRVWRGSDEIHLTPKEFELLTYFARRPNRVLTHRTLLTAIWGPNAASQPEHLWVLVGHLRKKLEPDPAHPQYLVSEPWVGYRFAPEEVHA